MAEGWEEVGLLEALVLGGSSSGSRYFDESVSDSAGKSDDEMLSASIVQYYWGKPTGINWCEKDYEWNPYIAEFHNTWSNVAFVLAGVQGLRTARRLSLPMRFYVLAWSLILLGVFSAGFHATLLWTQQKLDETFENLALIILVRSDRSNQAVTLAHGMLATLGIFTVTSFLFCELHMISIVLVTLFRVKGWVYRTEIVSAGEAGVKRAARVAILSATIGFICWIIDRVLCTQVLRLMFNPQLHAWWHILCGVALHEAFVLTVAFYQLDQALNLDRVDDIAVDVESMPCFLTPGRWGLDVVILPPSSTIHPNGKKKA